MNKDKRSVYDKAYYEANKEKKKAYYKEYNKVYCEVNKEKKRAYNKAYGQINKENRNKRDRERRSNDPSFKLLSNLRVRQRDVLKGKQSTTAGLGCTGQELCDYLAGLFQPGMTFDNHGMGEGCWHMDHIIPLDSHEKDSNGDWDSESQYNKQLIHYTNLQPLWEQDNLEKSNKIISYETSKDLGRASCGPNNKLP
jgi:phage-related tail protein